MREHQIGYGSAVVLTQAINRFGKWIPAGEIGMMSGWKQTGNELTYEVKFMPPHGNGRTGRALQVSYASAIILPNGVKEAYLQFIMHRDETGREIAPAIMVLILNLMIAIHENGGRAILADELEPDVATPLIDSGVCEKNGKNIIFHMDTPTPRT